MAALTIALIDEAISKVLTSGQSYRLPDGTVVTRASIDKLYELRRIVQAEEAAASNDGGYFVNVQFGRVS